MRNCIEDILQRIMERRFGQVRCTGPHQLVTDSAPCLRCGAAR